ncbi:MAG: hypothetical protein EAZ73_09075 [Oscillatoriales cyanobacterium]|uniref:hypothetical protein n=1 Tax=unclassified Microcoleus TaxID=2642155 RepID=UPI001DB815DC|nr:MULTISPECIES: hypothetical protein [unclassified Microcoleus]TAF00871.1 MAG: hypothetical protein EAZ79_01520 [Oscillatoriales cyanobacterium]MCC3459790.1 hypothetical protein [Microcoleus sp. PH2017_11_PCY_U_A]MCC3478223.1 hypothetical protein [Microcoleus sp. PH2017_12_PCY_D_A]TAF21370.1 MAG: hypothetical protein EAZ73_09075 [Oscillatoriales cyanobacterium]TAF39703.1 MAG: hypothetical protein EAZ69_00270 [Oscillatoriales cyanobacterium]
MLTAVLASKLLRQILVDYNYWPESESDSPLKIARSKTVLTDTAILGRDANMRRAAVRETDPDARSYKAPDRTIQCKTLDETFKPLAIQALLEVQTAAQDVSSAMAELETLERPIEKSEFLVQLYSAFKQLTNPKVCYVADASDPYTGFFITGETSDGEMIVAQTLLVQT